MNDKNAHTPLVLMILDGWGHREETEFNAIRLGDTPCWDEMWRDDPHTLIETSGETVGLPAGQMGNSEVGHMNIGAGRIVYQDFTRIAQAIRDGEFQQNPVLLGAIDTARNNGGTVHVMGLLSPGGVHSHDDQFIETVKLAAERGAPAIAVHAFLDGLPPGRHLLVVHGGVIRVITQDLGLDRFVATGSLVVVDWPARRLLRVHEPGNIGISG